LTQSAGKRTAIGRGVARVLAKAGGQRAEIILVRVREPPRL
jgi:hypothetical protein